MGAKKPAGTPKPKKSNYPRNDKAFMARVVEMYGEKGNAETCDYFWEEEGIFVPPTTIGTWGKKAGVSSGRTERNSPTRKAMESAQLDAKARRAAINLDILEQVEEMVKILKNPTSYKMLRQVKGSMVPDEVTFIPASERRDVVHTIVTAVNSVDKYQDRVDSQNPTGEARSHIKDVEKGVKWIGKKIAQGMDLKEVYEDDDEPELMEADDEGIDLDAEADQDES